MKGIQSILIILLCVVIQVSLNWLGWKPILGGIACGMWAIGLREIT